MTAGDLAVVLGGGAVPHRVRRPGRRADAGARHAPRPPPRGRHAARRDRPAARRPARRARVDAREVMDEARDDLERFDRVLGSAEAISDAVGVGGRRIYRAALSAPVIKATALATGTSRAARRMRRVTTVSSPRHVNCGGLMRRVTWFVGGVVAGAATAGYAKRRSAGRRPCSPRATSPAKPPAASGCGSSGSVTPCTRASTRCAARKPSCAPSATGRVEVLDTGLEPGDRVLVEGRLVEPGQVVILRDEAARRRGKSAPAAPAEPPRVAPEIRGRGRRRVAAVSVRGGSGGAGHGRPGGAGRCAAPGDGAGPGARRAERGGPLPPRRLQHDRRGEHRLPADHDRRGAGRGAPGERRRGAVRRPRFGDRPRRWRGAARRRRS